MVVILLVNVMEVYGDLSVHLDVPSIRFYLCMSSFRSLRAGAHVFALHMLFLCDFAYYVVG